MIPHVHQRAAFESFSVSAALILLAAAYVHGWFRLRSLHPDTLEGWRRTSFFFGLFSIWVAMASPIAALDHKMLTVHMVQHLLLMTIAPPLIWLGLPVKPFLNGLPKSFVQALNAPLLRFALRRIGKALTHPAVCWFAAAGTLVGWHIPAAFMMGLHFPMWHAIEQTSFLVTGLLFWWPVVQPWPAASKWPEWSILLYLFVATLPCDILSGFLVFCDRVVYPVYISPSPALAQAALQDQECAAALMWTCVTVVYLIAGTIVAARLLSPNRSREDWILESHTRFSTEPPANQPSVEVF